MKSHTYLGDPQSAADVDPLGPAAGGLHGSALLGAQQTLGLQPQGARPAQPAALWDLEDSVAGLGKPRQRPEGKRKEKKVRFSHCIYEF